MNKNLFKKKTWIIFTYVRESDFPTNFPEYNKTQKGNSWLFIRLAAASGCCYTRDEMAAVKSETMSSLNTNYLKDYDWFEA